MSNQTYSIKDLSKKYNIPASTLRYYESIGLLTDVIHTDKGFRIYNSEHIARLDGIMCFKRTGLTISKILEFYRYENDITNHADDIVSMMTEQEEHIIQQIHELTLDLAHIQDKVHYYTIVKAAVDRGETPPSWEDVLE